VILEGVAVEIVGFFSATKDRQGLPEPDNGKARTWLRRGGRVVFRCAAGGPFGLFDVVLPLFYNLLRCLGHTLVRMRSQLSDGETSLTFLWESGGELGVRVGTTITHPKNGFIYVLLLLQGAQNFHHGLDKKNTMG